MFSDFLSGSKIIYINDRHEEADTDKEDRRKLYDKRILPLLEENDFTIFGEKIDPFLWDYYRSLRLATIKPENIFYVQDYLGFPSLTEAVLADEPLIKAMVQRNIDLIIPYIDSWNTEKLAKKINTSLLREAEFTDWINNKSNYRQVIKELGLPIIAGCTTNLQKAEEDFNKIKNQGFQRAVLKKERSVSGFSVYIIRTLNDLRKCLETNFSNQESFVLEGFVEGIEYSPNLQYFITDKDVVFVVASDQLLEKDVVSYSGNIYPSFLLRRPDISNVINEMSQKICRYLQLNKCFGLVGIDYIVTKRGKIYSTEANVRLNGSTFPALIAKQLFGQEPNICWKFKTFHFKSTSFEKLFGRFKDFLKPKKDYGILPVGVDLLECMGEGQFMIIAENHNKLYDLYNKFLGLCSK